MSSLELGCTAVKHDLALSSPFDALDPEVYREHGAPYAVRWADKTFEMLDD